MATTHIVRRGIAGLATAAFVSGGLGVVGVALAGTAQARPNWCPGDPRPAAAPWPGFNWSSCYEFAIKGGVYGMTDLGDGSFHPADLGIPATPPPPNPPECIGFIPLPGADPSHCVI